MSPSDIAGFCVLPPSTFSSRDVIITVCVRWYDKRRKHSIFALSFGIMRHDPKAIVFQFSVCWPALAMHALVYRKRSGRQLYLFQALLTDRQLCAHFPPQRRENDCRRCQISFELNEFPRIDDDNG